MSFLLTSEGESNSETDDNSSYQDYLAIWDAYATSSGQYAGPNNWCKFGDPN